MPRPLDLLRIALVASSLAVPTALHGQASPAASRLIGGQIGVGFSLSAPNAPYASIKGGSIYGTFDVGRHLGIDGEIHDMTLFTPNDVGETSFLLGLRLHTTARRFSPYVKVLGGAGRFQSRFEDAAGNVSNSHRSYAIGAAGIGTDYILNRKVSIRVVDVEFQRWIGNNLTPIVATAGVAYRF